MTAHLIILCLVILCPVSYTHLDVYKRQATHTDFLRNKCKSAYQSGLPMLVSEFSICDASGNGGINKKSASKWMKLLKKYKIGHIAWNISNKNETSALIQSKCGKTDKISYKNRCV